MNNRYEQLWDLLSKELRVAYVATKEDPSEDFAIEVTLQNYLEKDLRLIGPVIEFFEGCEILELKLKLASVILDYSEYLPAYQLLVEDGRTPQWLFDVYPPVQQMSKKGIITI